MTGHGPPRISFASLRSFASSRSLLRLLPRHQPKPLAVPQDAQVLLAPVLATDGGVADVGLAVSTEAEEDDGVIDAGRPAPQALVARVDAWAWVEADRQDHGPGLAAERFDVAPEHV